MVFLAAISVEKRVGRLAAISVGTSGNHGPLLHILGAARALVTAKDGPNLIKFSLAPGVRKWSQKCGILSRD